MKRIKIFAGAVALTALCGAAPAWADLGRVTIGTNPQGTMYYVVGGGVAKMISDQFSVNATAQPYGGASVYLPLIQTGEVTMGLSSSLDSGLAYNGAGAYEKLGRLDGLRALVRAWPLPYAYFARGDSGMKTIADLKGKKVAVTLGANLSLKKANEVMLRAGGIDPDTDIEAVTVSGLPEGYALVTDKSIAAATTALGIPLARKADATLPGGLVMLGITGDNATTDFVSSQMSGLYITETKPGKNNPGVDKPKSVLGFDVFMVASDKLSDDDAYKLTKALYKQWDALQKDYGVLRRNPKDELSKATNTVPYHPGAIRYFKEAGLWTDKNAAHEAELLK
ncbi:TAXI family TRAP transporter solute-binding subunit [Aquicoccus sp. G2-2]|uniref:TAXI family TRAP transporter solute-binding subunit n=1 Tax=Aquicoccus sp. G2-2 TaxID=3092120 RepID=UPI002ADF3240|nr:TAXI family TRAP transporter solute-binding subunit [Aquicoccus sp. G2-2]MEA1114824.1 TAXI family TRAP transporter solute-binding subunit [Aquicoccus sp. G2-2]